MTTNRGFSVLGELGKTVQQHEDQRKDVMVYIFYFCSYNRNMLLYTLSNSLALTIKKIQILILMTIEFCSSEFLHKADWWIKIIWRHCISATCSAAGGSNVCMDRCDSLRLDFKSLLLYTGNPNRNDGTRWSTGAHEAGEGELYSGSCWTGKHSEGSWSAPALKVRCNFSVFKNGYVWVKFIKGFWFDHVPHLSCFKWFKLAVPFSDNVDSISATSFLFALKSISTTDMKTFCYLIEDQSHKPSYF